MVTPIAHRGASLFAPENTMAAFTLAVDMGMKDIECDVMLTADKIPILIHDDSLNRTTNGQGLVHQTTYEYIQSLDAGSWFAPHFKGIKVPKLAELLHWQKKTDITLHLEIKPIRNDNLPEDIGIIMSHINQYGESQKIKILSFQTAIFEHLSQQQSKFPRVLEVAHCQEKHIQEAQVTGCDQINISHHLFSRNRIRDIQTAGPKVGIFTVNNLDQIKELRTIPVDEIFTDDPTLFHAATNGTAKRPSYHHL